MFALPAAADGVFFAWLTNLGPWEMLIFGAVLLLLFGRRLPDVGRNLGRGVVQFRKGLQEVGDEMKKAGDESAEASPDSAKTDGDGSAEG